jgi:uncharacterized coiled-coil protein SlyX
MDVKFQIVEALLKKNKIMIHLFRKEKFDTNLYDLELKVESQQKQITELRELVLELSKQINSLQIEIDYLANNKYGKSI